MTVSPWVPFTMVKAAASAVPFRGERGWLTIDDDDDALNVTSNMSTPDCVSEGESLTRNNQASAATVRSIRPIYAMIQGRRSGGIKKFVVISGATALSLLRTMEPPIQLCNAIFNDEPFEEGQD